MSTTRSTFSHDLGNYIEHCDLSEGQIACAPYSVKHPILNAFTAFTAFSPAPTTRLSRDMADQRSIVGRDRRPFIVLYTPDQTDEGPVRIVLAARFDKRSVDDLDECTKRLIVALGDTPPYPDGSAPRIPVEPFWGSKHSYAIAHAIDLDPLRRATPYYERGTTGFCVNLQELGRLRAMCKRSSAYLKTLTARDHESLVRSYDVSPLLTSPITSEKLMECRYIKRDCVAKRLLATPLEALEYVSLYDGCHPC